MTTRLGETDFCPALANAVARPVVHALSLPAGVATINNRKAYEQGLAELPDWRIGCIFTNAKDRGKGVAAAAVAAALDEIKRAGGGVVEAYPEQTEQRPPQRGAYLHTGPEELYARYGFTRVRKIAKWRWVMRTKI